jgi:hypothetical protein
LAKHLTIEPIELSVKIEREQPKLPRYAVVPSSLIKPWRLSGTTTIELKINDTSVNRRTIKQLDRHRWFVSITDNDCARLGIDTGATVRLCLILTSPDLPNELAVLIRNDVAAAAAWAKLTKSERRTLRDEVASATDPAIRTRRARKGLLG